MVLEEFTGGFTMELHGVYFKVFYFPVEGRIQLIFIIMYPDIRLLVSKNCMLGRAICKVNF